MYHTIRKAGGTPLLTRADDRPFRYEGKGTEADRNRLFEDYGCRLYSYPSNTKNATGQSAIAIDHGSGKRFRPVKVLGREYFILSSLVHYLASDSNHASATRGPKPVTCEITFQYDPDKNINQKDRLTARKNAIAICRGIKTVLFQVLQNQLKTLIKKPRRKIHRSLVEADQSKKDP